jgi:CheY-like chemotaxis protein
MGGVEATRRIVVIQQEGISGRPVPVIRLLASVESADGWWAAGMSYLLEKPFSRKDIDRVLRLVDARSMPASPVAPKLLQIISIKSVLY